MINIDDYVDKGMIYSLYKLLTALSHCLGLSLRNPFYLKGAQKNCHLNYFQGEILGFPTVWLK